MKNEIDSGVWVKKDQLMSRQSALKAAALSFEGQGKDAQFLITVSDLLYSWVVQDQEYAHCCLCPGDKATGPMLGKAETSTAKVPDRPAAVDAPAEQRQQGETLSLPLPTPSQNVLLETFQSKYGYSKNQVLSAYGRYPNNSAEAKECLSKIQKT